mmetsp:Transcript_29967/g.41758  ORF Transcript_29967/g.41758 Transcript_29967/m.41758 type:complete len:441 (+) Transcript_29967:84-1406(+)
MLLCQNILSILTEINKFAPLIKLVHKKLTMPIQLSNLNIVYLIIFVSKMSMLLRYKSFLSQKKILNPLRKSIILIAINLRLVSFKLKLVDKDFMIKLIKTSLTQKFSQNQNFISNTFKLIGFITNRIKYYKNKTNIKNIFRNIFFSNYKNWYLYNKFFISKGLLFQKNSNHINFKRIKKYNPKIIIIPISSINKKSPLLTNSSINYCSKEHFRKLEIQYQVILQIVKNTNTDLILLDQKDNIITDLLKKYSKSTILNNFYSAELFNIIDNLNFEKDKKIGFYHNFNSSTYFRLNVCNCNYKIWLLVTNKSIKRKCLSIICTFTDYLFEKELLNQIRCLIVLITRILTDGRVLPSDCSVEFLITKMIKYKIQFTELTDIIVKSFYFIIHTMNYKINKISSHNYDSILKTNFKKGEIMDLRNINDQHAFINHTHISSRVFII